MGQTPAKFFPGPTPYGQSPDMGVLAQAKAADPAPLNNFLPLNPATPQPATQAPAQQPPGAGQGQMGPMVNLQRFRGYGGGLQRNMDF